MDSYGYAHMADYEPNFSTGGFAMLNDAAAHAFHLQFKQKHGDQKEKVCRFWM